MSFVGENISEAYPGWRLFLDGAANHQGKGIGVVLVSESRQHYPMEAMLRLNCTNNMAEYEACILCLKTAIDMNIYELLVICWRLRLFDSSSSRRMGCEEPNDYTLRTICAEVVQQIL